MRVHSSVNSLAEARAVFALHLPMAKRIAHGLAFKFRAVPAEDIEAGALFGLWQSAIKHYALPREQFEAVAYLRIRGGCVDVIRLEDHLTRHSRKLGLGKQIRRKSLDWLEFHDPLLAEVATQWDPDAELDTVARSAALQAAIERLPERLRGITRKVLAGRLQRVIAEEMGITEPRVNQMMTQATEMLREDLLGIAPKVKRRNRAPAKVKIPQRGRKRNRKP